MYIIGLNSDHGKFCSIRLLMMSRPNNGSDATGFEFLF